MSNDQAYAAGLLNKALDPATQPEAIRAFLRAEEVLVRAKKLNKKVVLPETEDEKRRYEDAGRRREIRQAEKTRKLERFKP